MCEGDSNHTHNNNNNNNESSSSSSSSSSTTDSLLKAILLEMKEIKLNQLVFEQKLEALALPPLTPKTLNGLTPVASPSSSIPIMNLGMSPLIQPLISIPSMNLSSSPSTNLLNEGGLLASLPVGLKSPSVEARKEATANGYSNRVILTTYPGQVGIHPIPLNWGAPTADERGPVVASRHANSIKVRNAIGAYAGSYSIYRALAAACGLIDPSHRPDYTNTEPPIDIKHNPSWDDKYKIVSLDPYGHLAPQVYKHYFDAGIDIRPTIAITKAHIKLIDVDEAVKSGNLEVDGTIVVETPTDWINANKAASGAAKTARPDEDAANQKNSYSNFDAGVEVNVSKAAVEPVWWLPGIAAKFGITEGALRRSLFEDTGGMYPELLTRHDLKTFLPPIGGLTVYIFGPVEYLSDETKELTLRVHDMCSGSDIFGSDICTCRPYLIFGILEAIKCAQRGGVGVVVYFTKEGRALGEVTKYLVYNARKRGGDNAAQYFERTELIAGVQDMRFQSLMPCVLHWLGIKKIDNMISMSNLKHDAIVKSGIPIIRRYEIPEDLIPPDGRVEIDAKIAAGYFSTTTVTDLSKTTGRLWEDLNH